MPLVMRSLRSLRRESIRAGDECARFGGDEFLIFAPDCDVDEATKIANRIMGRLSQSMPLAGARFSVSLGIAIHDGVHANFNRMYRDADAALYEGREDGKSRIGVFKPSTDDVNLIDRESKEGHRYASIRLKSNSTAEPMQRSSPIGRSSGSGMPEIFSANMSSPRRKASY